MADCIFCKIAAGEIASHTVYEDALLRVIMDLNPASPGHMLILPKAHYQDFFELPNEVASAAMLLAKRLALAAKKALPMDGLNIVQNNGKAAGQSVMHYHLHVVPRYQGVAFKLGEGSATQQELAEQAERIRAALEEAER